MLPYRDSRLVRICILALFLIVAGYAYYEIRGLLYGPRILVPDTAIETSEQFISLKGQAERIATLRMNGAAISVTETGAFEEPYLLSPGLNRIVFDAEDKYGRTRQEVMEVVYRPSESEPETATTTPPAEENPPVAPEMQ